MSGLDSKQLAERAAIAILNGRRVLVVAPEGALRDVADLCWQAVHEDMFPGTRVTRPGNRRWIEAEWPGCVGRRSMFVGPSDPVDRFEFDEFLYHRVTPAAIVNPLSPPSALEQIPAGVAAKLRVQAAADRRALDQRIQAGHLGTERVDGELVRVRSDNSWEWVVPPELRTLEQRAAEWLAGLNAMELQP